MYRLRFEKRYLRKYRSLVKNNPGLKATISKTLRLLSQDPFTPSLTSHKVFDSEGEPAFSVRVTGDLRIIWEYSKTERDAIDILDIGGHSGSKKVHR